MPSPADNNRSGGRAAVIRTEALTKVYAGPPAGPPGGWGPPPAAAGPPDEAPTSADGRRGGGPRPAVDRLDLTVEAGEIFGLLGPNGAGKTTTIGMLTTRVVPTSGQAYVAGIDVVHQPALAKQNIGVVTQTNTLDRSLNVWENLYFHGRYFGMSAKDAKAESDRLLEQFRLTEKTKADVNSLSGGLAQRLMVARSIMHRPSVLFLDEPTAGLDPQSRLSLWETIQDLNRQGQTVLLTTHYMEEADQLCRRVAVMDHGRILALDTPQELKRTVDADTVVTVQADGDQEALAAALHNVAGATHVVETPHGIQAHVRGGQGMLQRVLSAAESAGFAVNDIAVAEPTLETVFITLTGKDLRE